MINKTHILFLSFALTLAACAQTPNESQTKPMDMPVNSTDSLETITLGAGCFWCVEAVFQSINGVISAKSGYSGGAVKNPSYKEVCNGTTGHAEVVQVIFDPQIVSLSEILEVFFATHDPTTLNRQGGDEGTQYRSAIFYHTEDQKEIGKKAIDAAKESGEWSDPIVTELTSFDVFYPAEDYHQDYFNNNGSQPYCSRVISPKMDKFKKRFADKLKQGVH
jgi:peptide-methionine (S)-S-oxide reductase